MQACQDILQFTAEMHTSQDFQNDRRTMLAVIRSLEVIGEAARQLPKRFRQDHPIVPWREIADFRNVIAHEYFGLDFEIVWDIIQTQIRPLYEQVLQIRNNLSK